MLLLPLLLLADLTPGGDNEPRHAFQEPISFHLIQISSFANSTWAQNQGSGWLGDLQIHGWDSDSGTAIFLKPWSKGNFSNEEIAKLEEIFRIYFIGFVRVVQDHVSEFQMKYPFEIQGMAGCQLLSGETTESFLMGALGGLSFLSFENGSCVPSAAGGSRAQWFCTLFSQYEGIADIITKLLLETCPRFLLGVLEAGKAELQRQVKPKAWLSSGPPPGPGRLLLVCHASGFYPKPVRVTWMRGEQEQPGTHQGDVLPNADGTWYLRVTLDVAAGEAAGLTCRVRHSSLGGQDIVLYWGHIRISREILSCLFSHLE
ncbi:PREDICTED: T-cell surface glycoprotein CD1b-2-like isoform X2 [Miniopterus natalensis]|uniref:T-cell surface glycoprotein CD1b-2-like isoform X2 n=1 Tax=Miniopterus natalensis TaxID=291302 RepID=UPI0007A718D9|nr:PREDICTED: T-cell surface glycoprotein CD1b-2-like isoform X2 [Miniopterus natalensis]